MGTWRRQPHLRWNRQSVQELTIQQNIILSDAAKFVRLGGRLIYAVCSLLPEECEDIITTFLSQHEDFIIAAQSAIFEQVTGRSLPYPHNDYGIIIDPEIYNSDGFFISLMQRR